MTFYDRVQELCRKNNIKISNLVAELGMSTATPSNWKKSLPKGETVVTLAERFNVSTDYLLTGKQFYNYDFSGSGAMKVSDNTLNYSAIAQGNANSYVHVENGGKESPELSEMERELLDNFEKLPTKAKIEVLSTVYKLAEEN